MQAVKQLYAMLLKKDGSFFDSRRNGETFVPIGKGIQGPYFFQLFDISRL